MSIACSSCSSSTPSSRSRADSSPAVNATSGASRPRRPARVSAIRARTRAVASPSGVLPGWALRIVRAIHWRIRVVPSSTSASRTVRTWRRSPWLLPTDAIWSTWTTRPGSRRSTSSTSSNSMSSDSSVIASWTCATADAGIDEPRTMSGRSMA